MQKDGGVLEILSENATLDVTAASRYDDLRPGGYVKLTVRDSGHGIDPRNIDRIFDPYFTTKNLAEGTGMGLAVEHGIVKRHQGAITVESELGTGTVFEILLPLAEA
jgi:two-component system, cell cycle sensor histidine kinase and response regulator CckA